MADHYRLKLEQLKIKLLGFPLGTYDCLTRCFLTKIDKNDYVSVSGNMDDDTWEEQELVADTIIVLEDN
jgi:hypothetical protein